MDMDERSGDRARGTGASRDAPPDAEVVNAALQEIFSTSALGEKSRLRALLEFIVDEELAGRGDRIKGYAIGTLVFGRDEAFDPNADSIVRVEMNRLRQAIKHYYASEGAGAALRIDIPKGQYRPIFSWAEGGSGGIGPSKGAAFAPVARAPSAKRGVALRLSAVAAVLAVAVVAVTVLHDTSAPDCNAQGLAVFALQDGEARPGAPVLEVTADVRIEVQGDVALATAADVPRIVEDVVRVVVLQC